MYMSLQEPGGQGSCPRFLLTLTCQRLQCSPMLSSALIQVNVKVAVQDKLHYISIANDLAPPMKFVDLWQATYMYMLVCPQMFLSVGMQEQTLSRRATITQPHLLAFWLVYTLLVNILPPILTNSTQTVDSLWTDHIFGKTEIKVIYYDVINQSRCSWFWSL